jgi:hypothetical protein
MAGSVRFTHPTAALECGDPSSLFRRSCHPTRELLNTWPHPRAPASGAAGEGCAEVVAQSRVRSGVRSTWIVQHSATGGFRRTKVLRALEVAEMVDNLARPASIVASRLRGARRLLRNQTGRQGDRETGRQGDGSNRGLVETHGFRTSYSVLRTAYSALPAACWGVSSSA